MAFSPLKSLALAASLSGAVQARVPVPHAQGCNVILDRTACCLFKDGRAGTDYGGQDCVPSSPGAHFGQEEATQGPVCQPRCWALGTCGDGRDQSSKVGVCAAPQAWYGLGEGRACRADTEDGTTDGRGTAVRVGGVPELDTCRHLCLESPVCSGVEFSAAAGTCELWTRPSGHTAPAPGYSCWALARRAAGPVPSPTPAPTPAPLPAGVVEQVGAQVLPGGDVRFYAVGTSNAAWQTWPDQLHVMLKDLGYNVRTAPLHVAGALTRPAKAQVCADATSWSELNTPRFGMIGWSSWGFAYDSKVDCDADGYRQIAGYPVSCTNAWACNPKWQGRVPELNVTELAVGMQGADFVVLSNWINDAKAAQQTTAREVCYKGADISPLDTTDVTAANLKRLVRAIHAQNPKTVVLVLARYPDTQQTVYPNERTLPFVAQLNQAVKEKISGEPNTHFVDFAFPLGENMFQTLSTVHPNCRGDKVMATSVVDALFKHKILSRGLELGDASECLGAGACSDLSTSCCQRSALCHVVADGTCQAYGPGEHVQ